MGNFRYMFNEQAQIGVFNCLQILIIARKSDLSGENLSNLDLRGSPMNGVQFSEHTKFSMFDGSYISKNTFLLQDHSDKFVDVVYDNEGQRILSSSNDGSAKEWDRKKRKCVRTFGGRSWIVRNKIREPRSKNFDVAKKQILEHLLELSETSSTHISTSMYNMDERRVVIFYKGDGTVKEWDRISGECLRTYVLTEYKYNDRLVVSSNKKWVLQFNYEEVREWDIKTGELLRTSIVQQDKKREEIFINVIRSNKDKRELAICSDETIFESNSDNHEFLQVFNTCGKGLGQNIRILNAQYSSSGQFMLITYSDGSIKEWNRQKNETLQIFNPCSYETKYSTYSENEQYILFAHNNGSVIEWDRQRKECNYLRKRNLVNAGYSLDERHVIAYFNDGTTMKWDRTTSKKVHHTLVRITKVSYSVDGRKVAVFYDNRTVIEINKETGEMSSRKLRKIDKIIYSPEKKRRLTPDRKRVLIINEDGSIEEWNIKTRRCLWTIPPYGGVFVVGCSFKGCKFSDEEISKLIEVYGGILA